MVRGPKYITTCVLKSFEQAKKSVERCRQFQTEHYVFPHYGIVPAHLAETVFQDVIKDMEEKVQMVTGLYQKSMSAEEICSTIWKNTGNNWTVMTCRMRHFP